MDLLSVNSKSKPMRSLKKRPVAGRPRNPETQGEILRAAGLILVEEGYRALSRS